MPLFRARQRQSGLVTIFHIRQVEPVGNAAPEPEIRTSHRGLDDPGCPVSIPLELQRNRPRQVQSFEEALRRIEYGIVLHGLCDRSVAHWPGPELAPIEPSDHTSLVQVQRAERQLAL